MEVVIDLTRATSRKVADLKAARRELEAQLAALRAEAARRGDAKEQT